ncbi:MAG: carbohydrate kinase family protein [Caldicoprobacterales bacterium]|jgi:sugar/nucleoside kinase (ribokinase family)|nr:carbohydrate kinase family protein [Clostridiales bacterium]
MNYLLPIEEKGYKYQRLIGTGGIGSGILFNLDGDHTMGRNESRSGELTPFRDYCKLHIISHYPTVLLGQGKKGFQTYPIGHVGDDDAGAVLVQEMKAVGIDTSGVSVIQGKPTLFSVCFQYPDKSGGNITTSNSAAELVSEEDIDAFCAGMPVNGANEMILSVPEVPLAPRIRILEQGRKRGSFNIASFLSGEAAGFVAEGRIKLVDLLAINIDEAAAITGGAKGLASAEIALRCARQLMEDNPKIMLIVTCGAEGSYTWHQGRLEYSPTFAKPEDVVSTAGAGDAFLGGVIAGLLCGLPLTKGISDDTFGKTPLGSAVELGTLVSNLKVTSPDTIYHELDANMLIEACHIMDMKLSDAFETMFGYK